MRMPSRFRTRFNHERALALPLTLVLILVIGLLSATYTTMLTGVMHQRLQQEGAADTFQVAEGALNLAIGQLLTAPRDWIEMAPLSERPKGYQIFEPLGYSGNKGLPLCSEVGCERNYAPTGGGLLKNNGPLTGDGRKVNTAASITEQLDAVEPEPDITFSGTMGWSQIERLDVEPLGAGSLGQTLSTGATADRGVRFRITGTARRTVREVEGESTIVAIVLIRP